MPRQGLEQGEPGGRVSGVGISGKSRGGSNDLDVDEAAVFAQLVAAVMSTFFSAFAQYRRDLIAESTCVGYRNDWLHCNRMPGFHAAWESISDHYSIEFRQALNDFEKSAPGAG